jgi:hypothetical protein
MSGGGKGGTQKSTTTVALPKWMENAYKEALSLAEARAKMGYVPYTGPDVAAFNPMQTGTMQQSVDIANMFGMGPRGNVESMLPQAQEYAGGIKGYSSMPLYEEAQAGLGAKYPGLKSYLDSFFIDPKTGQMAANNPWSQAKAANAPPPSNGSGAPGASFGQWIEATTFPKLGGEMAQQDFQNQQFQNWLSKGSPFSGGGVNQ